MKKIMTILTAFMVFLSSLMIFPQNTANAATFNIDFETASKSLYLENLDTATVVYSKEANARRFPASTTKIMTYIITAENISDFENTFVTVKGSVLRQLDGTGSSVAGLEENEKLSIYQLLCCLMIPSGNDAAMILADYIGKGDISKFVDKMNAKAKELGCEGTHFANPHGLNDPNHYTTVSDMAKIAKYALTLPQFSEISNMTSSDCLGDDRFLITTNYMIDESRGGDYYYPYASGIKTGSTGNDSGYCLVSTATKDGYTYLCVAYGAPYEDENGESYDNGAMIDSANLYDWAFDNLSIKAIIEKNDLVKEININYAWNKDKIQLAPAKSYSTIMPDNVEIESIDKIYNVPETIDAPVKEGDKVGTITLSYANQELATIDLLASESVDRSDLLTAMDGLKTVATSRWFIIAVIIIGVLIFTYIIIVTVYNRKKQAHRPVKKYRKF
ncbi:MAG: D-alanyl-D-alanine carboxypeptidase [Clostridia bacterium]|nr:D-alanyl-D-alanine carboxypeptidase [Clostridia bacterium]